MEISTARAITQELSHKFGNPASLARVMKVDRSAIGRWLKGSQTPTGENEEKLMALSYVLAKLARMYRPETAQKWLVANNPFLGHKRPLDFIGDGRMAEVDVALEAVLTGGYL
jgi:transcriptional regulator with XRE-family HTH domain